MNNSGGMENWSALHVIESYLFSECFACGPTNQMLTSNPQVFWCWLVERVPLCIAPNMITLVGLLVNIGTTLVLVYYSSDGHSTVSCV